MCQGHLSADSFSPDTLEFLKVLQAHSVNYLIVGGEAVIYYGYARVTGDIDFFYDRTEENVDRLFEALSAFWSGTIPGIETKEELLEKGLILQFGVPPNRIDLVNDIDGITFAEAWPNRVRVLVASGDIEISIWLVCKDDLLKNKRAAGRPKDLDDLQFLEE